MNNLKEILNEEYNKRNKISEISFDKPDPLLIAKEQKNEYSILLCALFSYGNAKQIVKFIQKLPFDLLDRPVSEISIRKRLKGFKYRFQTEEDIIQIFLTIQRILIQEKEKQWVKNIQYDLKEPKKNMLYETFLENYEKNGTIEGIYSLIELLKQNSNNYKSQGFDFLIGNKNTKSPLKRWNMFLRWMVRNDNIDLGFWKSIKTSDLIIPLDTHTFNLGKKLKLINRKTYDILSAIELTNNLKKFDNIDPLKYDFVLYRLGQEKIGEINV